MSGSARSARTPRRGSSVWLRVGQAMLACSSDKGARGMAEARSRGRFGVTLGLVLGLVACGSQGGGGSPDADPNLGESDDALIPASCTEADARRFETLLVGDAKC